MNPEITEQTRQIHARAIVVSGSLNEALGLLDKAAVAILNLIKTEENPHNIRLYSGLYQGINSERAYVAEVERANRELMPDFVAPDDQPQFVPRPE